MSYPTKRIYFAAAVLADGFILWKFVSALISPEQHLGMLSSGSVLFFLGEMISIFGLAFIHASREDSKLSLGEVIGYSLFYGVFMLLLFQVTHNPTVVLVSMASFVAKLFFAQSISNLTVIRPAVIFVCSTMFMLLTQAITSNIAQPNDYIVLRANDPHPQVLLFWGIVHYSTSIIVGFKPQLLFPSTPPHNEPHAKNKITIRRIK